MSKYDGERLADLGYGDTGAVVVDLTAAEVGAIAEAVHRGGTSDLTCAEMVSEIERCRIDDPQYTIVVGEAGNEAGHVSTHACADDAAAVRQARRLCRVYRGDGWWIVRDDTGRELARGGRERL